MRNFFYNLNYYLDKVKLEVKINQNQWYGVLFLIFLIFIAQYLSIRLFNEKEAPFVYVGNSIGFKEVRQIKTITNIKPFNPNKLTKEGWLQLGFSQRQVQSIFKYKKMLGGKFTSLNQIKNCYVINEQKFNQIKPYMVIEKKEDNNYVDKELKHTKHQEAKGKIVYKEFDPNELDGEGWRKMGFSEKQSQAILKYKHLLGGRFFSMNQIKNCYVVSLEKYQEMEPYMVFKKNIREKKELNKMNIEDFEQEGIDARVAQRIINYRNALGGFVDKNQLKEVYGISEFMVERILNKVETKLEVKKIDINNCNSLELFKHPYFRKIAKKILITKEGKGSVSYEEIKQFAKEENLNYNIIRLYLQPD